jgi:PKD domain-containing protein/Big-like domain-containing protein
MVARNALLRFGLVGLVALAACDQLPLLAPTGSTVTLTSSHIVLGVSETAELTATIIETGGTPVHNGTLVVFSTTLGQLDLTEARTNSGRTTVRLSANGASGVARITASSGGARSEALEITIGAAAADTVSLSASPGTIPPLGGSVVLTATVRGTGGQGLAGIPVSFSATSGSLNPTTAVTDSLGDARSTLTASQESRVQARAGTKVSSELTIGVRAATGLTVTAPATAPLAGAVTTISVAPIGTNAVVRNVVLEFGDGSSTPLGTITAATSVPHIYQSSGTYSVRATGIDSNGDAASGATSVIVLPSAPVNVNLTASPNPATVSAQVTLTAVVTPTTTQVERFVWNFGDGSPVISTSGNITTHGYAAIGTYTVTVTVTTTDGTTPSPGRVEVRVQ